MSVIQASQVPKLPVTVAQAPQESEPSGFFHWLAVLLGFKKEIPPGISEEQRLSIQALLKEMQQIERDLCHSEEDNRTMSLETLYKQMVKSKEKVRAKTAETIGLCLTKDQDLQTAYRTEQQRENEKLLESAKQSNFWKNIASLGSTVQTIFFAIALPPGLNAAAVAVAILLGADKLLGDPGKACLSDWLAKGHHEGKENWLQRFRFLADCTTLALGLPQAAQAGALGMGLAGAQVGTAAADGFYNCKKQMSQAELERLKYVLELIQQQQQNSMDAMSHTHQEQEQDTALFAKLCRDAAQVSFQ